MDIANREVLTKGYGILLYGLSRWHCQRDGRNLCDDGRKENAKGGRGWKTEIGAGSRCYRCRFVFRPRCAHAARKNRRHRPLVAQRIPCARRTRRPGMILGRSKWVYIEPSIRCGQRLTKWV